MREFIGLLVLVSCCEAFIVPQELPSILSLVYSNIPPIKKGTDSRVGFGYRLGEHADFQVLFELGPQTNTRPIGTGASNDESETSKRNVDQSDYNKKLKPINGQQWLNNWSEDMKIKTKKTLTQPDTKGAGQTDTPSVQTMPFISESALKQLQQLYGQSKNPLSSASTNEDIGTLPAESLEQEVKDVVKKMNEQTKMTIKQQMNKQKISAELQDVNLDDD